MSAAERRARTEPRRVRRTLLFFALAAAMCASTVGVAAPRKRGSATRAASKTDAAASSSADGGTASTSGADASTRTAGSAAAAGRDTTAGATSASGASGGDGGATVTTKGDGGAKVFRFGELEIEGRLKSPQLVYFLRRVRAEFSAGDLGHRSFFPELAQTKDDPNF